MGGEKKELQPWELKLIGRRERYTNSWMGWLARKMWNFGGGYFDKGVDYVFNNLGKSINPDIKRYELYGKKIDRPWGRGWGALYTVVEQLVTSDVVKASVSNSLKRTFGDTNQVQYASGATVAAACFVPSVMQRGRRPAIHFDERHMVEFYNELGIMPDEAAMIGDMLAETIKIKDSNFSDEMWRTHVMPVIISEGYKKELNTVYGILHKEYMDNPAMTKEQLEARMDKAQKLLGKLYQEFSVSVANYTEYLEAPLKLLESDGKEALSAEPKQELTREEKAKFDAYQQKSLVSKSELKYFKKLALKTERPEAKEDLVQAFYRSLSGYVGKESERAVNYKPKPLTGGKEPEDNHNACCFINAVAALKKYEQSISNSSNAEYLEIANLMRENLAEGFGLSEKEMNYIMERGTTLQSIQNRYDITREVFFGYEPMEVPKPYTWKEEITNFANTAYQGVVTGAQMISDGWEVTKEVGTQMISDGWEVAKEVGTQMISDGWEVVKEAGTTIGDIATGNVVGDIKVEFTEDDFDGLFGEDKTEEIRQNYKREQERLRLEKEEQQKRIEAERLQQEEEQLRKEKEEETRLAKEKDKLLDKLEPWQKKLISHQARYSDTWMGQLRQAISSNFGESIDSGVDAIFNYLGNSINPEVKTYEVFGKKLDRPWGRMTGVSCSLLSSLVKSDMLSGPLKGTIKRKLLTPGIAQYASEKEVVLTCFAPTFIQGERRPPCHFSKSSMVRFYNATGIQPDEHAIVDDMMRETRKIADYNYTDEQWRTMLMPQILKGSFQKQLKHVFEMITEDYQENPAITDKMYRERLENASNALGEMYCDFSRRIANTTEYLEAPMQFHGIETGSQIPEEVMKALTEKQKKQIQGVKHQTLISESELKHMISDAASVKRKEETVGSLLEQFYKATSGYIGNNENFPNYVPKPLDVNNRDMENERCLISALTAAKRIAEQLSNKETHNQGFFTRLFGGKKDTSEERICLDAMKESLAAYGFSAEKIDAMLKPETTMESIRQELGIDDKTILGIKEKAVPEETEEKGYVDYVRDYAYKLKPLQDVTIGAVKIAAKGTSFLFTKTKDFIYNMVNGGQPDGDSKEEVIAEVEVPKQPKEQEKEKEETLDIDTQLETVNGAELDEDVMKEFRESENREYKNTSYFSWAASAGKSFMGFGNTKPQAMHQLLTKRDVLVDELREKASTLDSEGIYQGLAKMEYFTTLQKALEEDKLTPDSVMKGIEDQRVERDSTKFAGTEKFRKTCDRLLNSKTLEERISDETFPEKLHKAVVLKNTEIKQQKEMEASKAKERSNEDEYDYSFDINF